MRRPSGAGDEPTEAQFRKRVSLLQLRDAEYEFAMGKLGEDDYQIASEGDFRRGAGGHPGRGGGGPPQGAYFEGPSNAELEEEIASVRSRISGGVFLLRVRPSEPGGESVLRRVREPAPGPDRSTIDLGSDPDPRGFLRAFSSQSPSSARLLIGSRFSTATGLAREFGPIRAVDGVSFALGAGELMTVFGPNGAGKTTLLRILSGGLQTVGGRGGPPGGEAGDGRSGMAPPYRCALPSDLSLRASHPGGEPPVLWTAVRAHGPGYPRSRAVGAGRADRAMPRARPGPLSRGMRQRLALARTLLHDPDFVLLDEPYTGLDAHAAAVLRGVLSSLKDGHRTVILVTHNISQGLELADRVADPGAGSLRAPRGPVEEWTPAPSSSSYREKVEEVG